jgi:hypothetical protein
MIVSGLSCNDFVAIRWGFVLTQLSNAEQLRDVRHQL